MDELSYKNVNRYLVYTFLVMTNTFIALLADGSILIPLPVSVGFQLWLIVRTRSVWNLVPELSRSAVRKSSCRSGTRPARSGSGPSPGQYGSGQARSPRQEHFRAVTRSVRVRSGPGPVWPSLENWVGEQVEQRKFIHPPIGEATSL